MKLVIGILITLAAANLLIACGGGSSGAVRSRPITSVTDQAPTIVSQPTSTAIIAAVTPATVSSNCQKGLGDLIRQHDPLWGSGTPSTRVGDVYLLDTPNYRVDYLLSSGSGVLVKGFLVQIWAKPYDTNKQAVEKWFSDQGCSLSELCTIRIQFAASKQVQEDFSQGQGLPTGCTINPLD